MATVLTPLDTFKGGAGIVDANQAVGEDRDLATTLREVQTLANAVEASVGGITSPFQYIGDINAAADFPLIVDVEKGWFYTVSTGCTDNGGATRTNTGRVFVAGDEIVWTGTTWTLLGRSGRTFTPAIDLQAVAADATTNSFIAPAAGTILGVYAKSGATAAVGESMTFDVQIAGVTCLTAPISIAPAQTTVAQAGTLAAAVSFTAGQVITIIRDYTAGGGPTPMVNTLVSIFAQLT